VVFEAFRLQAAEQRQHGGDHVAGEVGVGGARVEVCQLADQDRVQDLKVGVEGRGGQFHDLICDR